MNTREKDANHLTRRDIMICIRNENNESNARMLQLVCNQLRRWMGQIDYSFDQRGYVSKETVVGGEYYN